MFQGGTLYTQQEREEWGPVKERLILRRLIVAGDTGGAIKGKKVDLFIPSKSQAYEFGRKKVRIKILD